jgi:hypothetical protein
VSWRKQPKATKVFHLREALGATWSIVQYLNSDRWVIRPKGNTNLNLNASGDGPYEQGNPVNLWRWETGAHNEVWIINPR